MYTLLIAVIARYNPFAEHAGMTKVGESKPDRSILEVVTKLENLGFKYYLLAVPEYNKQKLKRIAPQVKEILNHFNYPHNIKIAGAHGRFTIENYKEWLQNVEKCELARAISRLAQLNQTKVYLFWEKYP